MMKERELYLLMSILKLSRKSIEAISPFFYLCEDSMDLFSLRIQELLGEKEKKKLAVSWDKVLSDTYERCDVLEIGILTIVDDEYPQELREIKDPPFVLYYRGDLLRALSFPRMGIVGSRKHTSYGANTCGQIVRDLTDLGVSVVSGMALGLDGIAHKTALEGILPTIAVLGCGVDVIYPKSHSALYLNILENGAVVSEYPPGEGPKPFHFPERNRIISGLSRGVIVIEAREKSGSLITARLAAEQGREVFAVPGNLNSLYSKGTNLLIRDGAEIYLEKEDLHRLFPEKKQEPKEYLFELSAEEQKIISLIQQGENTANLLCIALEEDVNYINSILTILEMKGAIENEGADRFVCIFS